MPLKSDLNAAAARANLDAIADLAVAKKTRDFSLYQVFEYRWARRGGAKKRPSDFAKGENLRTDKSLPPGEEIRMKWSEWLDSWSMTGLKITTGFLNMEFNPKDEDKDAAWELYIELLTRITTQPLPTVHGDEKTALDSVYSLFASTREVLKLRGRHATEFTKIAIVVLNQVVRPFTAKWHKRSLAGAFSDRSSCDDFRKELETLQAELRNYTQMLGDMAGVEDLTKLEEA